MKVKINTYYSVYGANDVNATESTNEIISQLEAEGNTIIDVKVHTDYNFNITVTILYEFSEEKLSKILKKPRIQTF